MHDPLSVAFEIRYPWYKHRPGKEKCFPKGYRESFITIWHRDPEKDGSDNSCDWFGGNRLNAETKKKVFKEADFEYETEQFFFDREGRPQTSCLEMVLGIAGILLWRVWRRKMTPGLLIYLQSLATSPVGNFQSNHRRGITEKEELRDLFRWIAGAILRHHRPWWKHPRWHLWHWRFQIHPLQSIRIWLFRKCYICGKGWPWSHRRGRGMCHDGKGHYHQDCKIKREAERALGQEKRSD